MRDPLIAAVIFNFLALVVVAVLWSAESRRSDRLAYEMACLRYDLGLPEPLPEPRWWHRVRDWLREVPGAEVEPATTTPMPVVTVDTLPSQAVVVGGARIKAEPLPDRTAAQQREANWVETELARFNFDGGRR